MKNLTVYKFEGSADFNEDFISQNKERDLYSEEETLIHFKPLFEDTYVQKVEGFAIAKIVYLQRKEPDKVFVEKEALKELPEYYTEEEFINKVSDLRKKFIQFTGMKTPQDSLVIIDNSSKKMVIGNTPSNSDNVVSKVLESVEGFESVELVSFATPIVEKLLTEFILDESKNLPDPFMLVEKVNLGDKSEFEKNPKNATINIKKEYPADEEVVAFINNRHKVVKLLQLDYDGVFEFEVTNKFEIKGLKFKEELAYKKDEDSSESLNFMSQHVLQLPTMFDVVNSLENQFSKVVY